MAATLDMGPHETPTKNVSKFMEQGGLGAPPTSRPYCYPVLTPCESPAPLRLICPAKIGDADFKFLCKQNQNFLSFGLRHFLPLTLLSTLPFAFNLGQARA